MPVNSGPNLQNLAKILECKLSNKRASKDLLNLIGIKGAFTTVVTTGAISAVSGEGFTVEPDATAGTFRIYFKEGYVPKEIYEISASFFTVKTYAAAGDSVKADVAFYDLTAARPYVSVRICNVATPFAVNAVAGVMSFSISGRYSDVGIYE